MGVVIGTQHRRALSRIGSEQGARLCQSVKRAEAPTCGRVSVRAGGVLSPLTSSAAAPTTTARLHRALRPAPHPTACSSPPTLRRCATPTRVVLLTAEHTPLGRRALRGTVDGRATRIEESMARVI